MRIFRRRPSRPVPTATGHAGDDDLLRMIARQADLYAPRDWEHFLHFPDEAGARRAGDLVTAAGWELQALEPAAGGPQWVVIAEKRDTVISEDAVTAARQFFEHVAAEVPGGEYDGWGTQL